MKLVRISYVIISITICSACVNIGNPQNDTTECRQLAYGKNNNTIGSAADDMYNKCQEDRQNARIEASVKADEATFIDLLVDLFWPYGN